jgi:hypothetical protein
VLTERAIEEPDSRRSAEMKRMVNGMWSHWLLFWQPSSKHESIRRGVEFFGVRNNA